MDAKERFIEVLDELINKGIVRNDADFARQIGKAPTSISDIRNNRKKPSANILEALAKKYNISIEYINTGEGGKFIPSDNPLYSRDLVNEALLRTILYQIVDVKSHLLKKNVSDVLKEVFEDNAEVLARLKAGANKK